ncbi:MAG: cell division protein SepF [Candidatus Aenigmatarchaeota archaeon]
MKKMGLADILGKLKPAETISQDSDREYVELDLPGTEEIRGKILIRIDKLEEYTDSDRIQKLVRDGDIVLVKIKELKEKDISELKRAIARIRKTCIAVNGDIAGVADDWVIVTPSYAHIHREGLGQAKASSEEGEKIRADEA